MGRIRKPVEAPVDPDWQPYETPADWDGVCADCESPIRPSTFAAIRVSTGAVYCKIGCNIGTYRRTVPKEERDKQAREMLALLGDYYGPVPEPIFRVVPKGANMETATQDTAIPPVDPAPEAPGRMAQIIKSVEENISAAFDTSIAAADAQIMIHHIEHRLTELEASALLNATGASVERRKAEATVALASDPVAIAARDELVKARGEFARMQAASDAARRRVRFYTALVQGGSAV